MHISSLTGLLACQWCFNELVIDLAAFHEISPQEAWCDLAGATRAPQEAEVPTSESATLSIGEFHFG